MKKTMFVMLMGILAVMLVVCGNSDKEIVEVSPEKEVVETEEVAYSFTIGEKLDEIRAAEIRERGYQSLEEARLVATVEGNLDMVETYDELIEIRDDLKELENCLKIYEVYGKDAAAAYYDAYVD